MYRIELAPGEEALFRTIDELAKAIHSGVVGSHSRVWHSASNKWLPIDFHPHYRIAKERPIAAAAKAPAPAVVPPVPHVTAPAPAPAVVAVPAPARAVSPFAPPAAAIQPAASPAASPAPAPTAASNSKSGEIQFIAVETPHAPRPAPAPAPRPAPLASQVPLVLVDGPVEPATPRHIEALVAMAKASPARVRAEDAEVTIDISAPPSRFSRRTIGMAAAGLFVATGIIGAFLSRKAPVPGSDGGDMVVASTSLAATPASSFEAEATSSNPGYTIIPGGAPAAAAAEKKDSVAKPVIPAAPSLAASRAALSISESSLTDVSGEAQAELESRLRASGLANVFAPTRLDHEQIGSSRLAAAGAANLVRGYRAKASRKESAEGRRAADALLADIEGLLGVLADNEGAYELSPAGISFSDPAVGEQYRIVRRRLAGRLSSGDSGSAVAASLLRLIGATRPPVETAPGN